MNPDRSILFSKSANRECLSHSASSDAIPKCYCCVATTGYHARQQVEIRLIELGVCEDVLPFLPPTDMQILNKPTFNVLTPIRAIERGESPCKPRQRGQKQGCSC